MPPRIAVLGGGITGLSACYHLEKIGFGPIALFERSARLGGKIQTNFHNDLVLEAGPDSIFTRKSEIVDFIREIGLEDQMITPAASGYSILLDGALRPIPSGLAQVTNLNLEALENFSHLSREAKERVRAEPTVPPNLDSDETVGSFFCRRFGAEYSEKIAEPLFAGTHGGSADDLSMQALYPDFRALEREFGCLAGPRNGQDNRTGGKFVSFKTGTSAIATHISARLTKTATVTRTASDFTLTEDQVQVDGEEFDAVVLAIPSADASKLLSQALPEVATKLDQIKANSSAIVTFAFDETNKELELVGTGFLVPPNHPGQVRGGTWSSNKWKDRSKSQALIRVFLKWQSAPDRVLRDQAISFLREFQGIQSEPIFEQVVRWENALPEYRLGHAELVDDLQALALAAGPIFLAGQSYRGVGIPDCILQGKEAAASVAARFL